MTPIRLEIVREKESAPALLASDDIEQRLVSSVEDLRKLIADRTESITITQHHGLGIMAALIAVHEFANRYAIDDVGKVLDSIYFSTGSPEAGQALSRGVGEALFVLRRSGQFEQGEQALLETAKSELRVVSST